MLTMTELLSNNEFWIIISFFVVFPLNIAHALWKIKRNRYDSYSNPEKVRRPHAGRPVGIRSFKRKAEKNKKKTLRTKKGYK